MQKIYFTSHEINELLKAEVAKRRNNPAIVKVVDVLEDGSDEEGDETNLAGIEVWFE